MARGRPKKNSSPKNVESPEIVLENVEEQEIVLENVESPEIVLENVEEQEIVLENVEIDVQEESKEEIVEETPKQQKSPRVLNKKPSVEDIIRWRRLGRR